MRNTRSTIVGSALLLGAGISVLSLASLRDHVSMARHPLPTIASSAHKCDMPTTSTSTTILGKGCSWDIATDLANEVNGFPRVVTDDSIYLAAVDTEAMVYLVDYEGNISVTICDSSPLPGCPQFPNWMKR